MSLLFPTFADCEASSLNMGHSYPIEIAWNDPDGTIHSYLITPAYSWDDWDYESEKIHNIRRKDLFNFGLPVHEVAAKVSEAFSGKVIYSDAPFFDNYWCLRLLDEANIPANFKFKHINEIIYGVFKEDLEQARRLAGPAHRAENDVKYLMELYKIFCAKGIDN